MLRRALIFAAVAMFCCAASLALRPMLGRPLLANLDEAPQRNSVAERLANSPLQARAFYGRRLEPSGDAILHGAGQSDRSSFDRYTDSVRPFAPMLFMSYVDLRDDLPAFFARLSGDLQHFEARAGAPAFIVPQIGLSLNGGRATKHYEAETAAGTDDQAIARFCTGVHALNRPIFLRVGYEFNGPWNGYQPQAYVAAFRRIAASLHACDAAGIAFVWDWSADAELDAEAGGADPATLSTRLQAFYPGDDAVDWWGLNLFSAPGLTAPSTDAFLRAADFSRHPVMIAESTPKGLSINVRRDWFAPYFGLLRSAPGVKAFCYIDWNWAAYPQWQDWGDARIEQNPDLLDWYRHQIASPDMRNAAGRAATLRLLRIAEAP